MPRAPTQQNSEMELQDDRGIGKNVSAKPESVVEILTNALKLTAEIENAVETVERRRGECADGVLEEEVTIACDRLRHKLAELLSSVMLDPPYAGVSASAGRHS